jgi:hypothetical protein
MGIKTTDVIADKLKKELQEDKTMKLIVHGIGLDIALCQCGNSHFMVGADMKDSVTIICTACKTVHTVLKRIQPDEGFQGETLTQPMSQQWEYLREAYISDDKMNGLGTQGWELVFMYPGILGCLTAIFKRPLLKG